MTIPRAIITIFIIDVEGGGGVVGKKNIRGNGKVCILFGVMVAQVCIYLL